METARERSKTEASAPEPLQKLAELYDGEMDRVYRYIAYHVGSAQEAEDLAADVFQRALQHWPKIHDQLNSPRAWLMTVAHNLVNEHFRRQARPLVPLAADPPEKSSPEEVVVKREETGVLLERVGRLPDRERTVLTLRFAGGLSHREIGEVLQISEGASAVALLRGLRRLRQAYEGEPR